MFCSSVTSKPSCAKSESKGLQPKPLHAVANKIKLNNRYEIAIGTQHYKWYCDQLSPTTADYTPRGRSTRPTSVEDVAGRNHVLQRIGASSSCKIMGLLELA